MANLEKTGTMKYKDSDGNITNMYPKTKAENVEGLSDLIDGAKDIFWVTYDDATLTGQTLGDARDAGKLILCNYQNILYTLVISNWSRLDATQFVFVPLTGSPLITTDDDDNYLIRTNKRQCLLFTDMSAVSGGVTWEFVTKQNGFSPESLHAAQHAAGAKDAITPASIGAATMTEVNTAIQTAIQNTWEASY